MLVPSIELRPDYPISRVICGGWQLAGGHGAVDRVAAVADLVAFAETGILTFDCADIYTGVEELLGEVRREYGRKHGSEALRRMKIHTKCVPNLTTLAQTSRASIRAIVDSSLKRLGMHRLDLVQFHWWDYAVPGCAEAVGWLLELQREGKIDCVGGTNFDARHTAELIAGGLDLVSMQVQYSLVDNRPEHGLAEVCRRHGIHLLCYGTIAGGFLSDRWLGTAEPQPPFENRSLIKYKLIIDDFGGWDLFQELLRTLRRIADSHETDIASIASRAILDRPMVAAVIVGARNRGHLAANEALASIELSEAERLEIDGVTARQRGPAGDTFTLERDRTGRHGSIMKYNLNVVVS